MPDFTVHQLSVFRTVARCLSYTKAAEALYLSQPAVSQQVKALEQALGLPLFARSGRGIVLTPAGQEMQRHVERLLDLFAETAPVVQEIQALERGELLVGASNSAGTYVVPPLLGAFHARYPRIHITLTVANRRSVEELLLNRELDMAVMSLVEREEHFAVEFLMSYELVVVATPYHRLARHSALRLRDVQPETFLLREHGSGTRLDTEHHFEHLGVPLRASLELGSIEAIKEGVAAGLGVAVLPWDAVSFEIASGDLVRLDVEGFPLERHWHLVHLRGRRLSLAAQAFRELLLQRRDRSG
jgi:LysR family transcriptional regulator, low CO2-responsive transcriptional regulator